MTLTLRFFLTLSDSSNSPGWLMRNYMYRLFYSALQQQLINFVLRCRELYLFPSSFRYCGGMKSASYSYLQPAQTLTLFYESSSERVTRGLTNFYSWLTLISFSGATAGPLRAASKLRKLVGICTQLRQACSQCQYGGGGQEKQRFWSRKGYQKFLEFIELFCAVCSHWGTRQADAICARASSSRLIIALFLNIIIVDQTPQCQKCVNFHQSEKYYEH